MTRPGFETRRFVFPALALLFLALPWFVHSSFWLGFWTMAMFFALMGQSWNILGGFGGQISFGHAVFFGTGAYVSAVLQSRYGINAWVSAAVAAGAGTLVGTFIGAVSFRYGLRGSYFALVTLAFAEVFRVLVNAWDFTGAGFGMLLALKPGAMNLQFVDRKGFYYLILALVAVSVALARWLEHSRFGAYLIAIRENEDAAQALGINCFRIKLLAITMSAALAALGGAFYTQYFLFVDSNIAYGPAMSVNALLAPMVGGAGTVLGPLIGAMALAGLSEFANAVIGKTPGVSLLTYGLLLLVILRFLPNGLMGLFRDRS